MKKNKDFHLQFFCRKQQFIGKNYPPTLVKAIYLSPNRLHPHYLKQAISRKRKGNSLVLRTKCQAPFHSTHLSKKRCETDKVTFLRIA